MKYPDTPQPRRTVMWDEANARYIWLDPAERDAARSIRARRHDFQTNTPAGVYTSGLADLWNPDEYDAATRQVARMREFVRRPEVKALRREKMRAAKGNAAQKFAAGFDPIRFDEIVPLMADILAALVAPPSLADVLDGMGCADLLS